MPERFSSCERLFGASGLQRLGNAHICLVGIGGVGSWAGEALARSSIGAMTLIDLDDICVTNINRQVHALDGTVGQPKVEVMADRIRSINPACRVITTCAFVTPNNVTEMLEPQYDFVLDATDAVPTKCAMIAHCRRNKTPLLTIGAAGGQTDPTRIRRCDLSRTTQDPLLASVRKRLRRDYHFPTNPKRRFGVECIYSDQQMAYFHSDGSILPSRPTHMGTSRLDCQGGVGASVCVTAAFGLTAAARIIEKLTDVRKKGRQPT